MSLPDDRLGKFYAHTFLRDGSSGPPVGVCVFDVDTLTFHADARTPNAVADTKTIYDKAMQGRLYIDWDRVRALGPEDLKRPAIGVTVRHPTMGIEYEDVADGNHRIVRAYMNGQRTFPVVQFDFADSEKCLLPKPFVDRLFELGIVP